MTDSLLELSRGRLPALLADLRTLVAVESPTADLAAVARSAEAVRRLGARLLCEAGEIITIGGVSHLRWRLGGGLRRVLLLCHHDTVWPIGSWVQPTVTNDPGEVFRGPGSFDMKAGLLQGLHAMSLLLDGGYDLDGVTVLVTGDEETGSGTSRALIEEEASAHRAVLVLEGAADGGGLKTARKGVSIYHVEIEGRAAHAGLEPHLGINAAVEVAHQVLAITALADPCTETTVLPTVIGAGSTVNTTAAAGFIQVDVRSWSAAELRRVDTGMRSLSSAVPGSFIRVQGGNNRPPLEDAMAAELYERACLVASGLGLAVPEAVRVGGASDGNFTAAIGIPTLDGLGAVGGGAHAVSEHVEVPFLAERTALLAGLVASLLTAGPPPVEAA